MGIGFGIFLLAVGAILAFAVHATVAGLDVHVVGWILMAAGALGLVLTLAVLAPRRRQRTIIKPVASHPRNQSRFDQHHHGRRCRPAGPRRRPVTGGAAGPWASLCGGGREPDQSRRSRCPAPARPGVWRRWHGACGGSGSRRHGYTPGHAPGRYWESAGPQPRPPSRWSEGGAGHRADGTDRAIDVGRIEPTGRSGRIERTERFTGMAGAGFDAVTMPRRSSRPGWAGPHTSCPLFGTYAVRRCGCRCPSTAARRSASAREPW